MRTNKLLAIALLFSFLIPFATFGAGSLPNDQICSELLIGTWQHIKQDKQMKLTAETTFRNDGTWSGYGLMVTPNQTNEVLLSGTWSVQNGKLIEKVVSSNVDWMVGSESVDDLISIDSKTYKFKNKYGETETSTRNN